jgi:hypothetical protein
MLALKTTFALLALGFVGCSSSSTREPFPLTEDNSEKIPPAAFGDETPASTPQSEPAPKPSAAAKPAAKKKETPAPAPSCATEQEPNNQPDQATAFKECISGALSGWTDVDNLQITAPQNVANMDIDHLDSTGGINYNVTARQGGSGTNSNFNLSFSSGSNTQHSKVTPGMTYIVQVKWDNNGAGQVSDSRPYVFRVSFQ